jgi:predicted nucleic acid-binding protein
LTATVLDSFALLAYFRGERGGDEVKELLQKANRSDKHLHMTEVNYAEVKYITIRKSGASRWREVEKTIVALPLEFHPVTRELSDIAADIKSRYSISLADAFAVALAMIKKAELVTGDNELKQLEKEIKITWLRR